MSEIQIKNMSKSYVEGEYAIKDVDLTIGDEEIFMLLGPSGCGKTTTLNVIAGFIEPTEGTAKMGNEVITDPNPDRGMIFQETDAAIFPWQTAQENTEFGLRMTDVPKEERAEIAKEYLDMVGLLEAKDKYPDELSGGMKQRIQMARTLALEPDVLLADEPFASLDAQTKRILQQELLDIWRQSKTTIVFVTHDIEEAVVLGHRIGVFSHGPDAEIKEVLEVPLDYPRDLTSPKCREIINKAEELIGLEKVKEI